MIIMLLNSLKQAAKTNPNLLLKNRNRNLDSYSFCCFIVSQSPSPTVESPQNLDINAKDVVASFKSWFLSGNNALFDRIFSILSSQDHPTADDEASLRAADVALSQLNLRLTESFVLQVLAYGRSSKDVLACLRFFDWAGRQRGFHHSRATFHAIFKILSRTKFVSLMLEFLEDYSRYAELFQRVRFHDTLVIGYAIAGKPERALQLFGKMRFHGLDLDEFCYHVLLNALVEESCFDAVDMIAKQISLRGFENSVTHTIMVKSLCKQKKLDEAQAYLRRFAEGRNRVSGHAVGVVVDALCKHQGFDNAATLLEEFRELNVPMEQAYSIWLRNLVQVGKLSGALEFLKSKKLQDEYVPDVFRYNFLLLRLLRKNRFYDVLDLLTEMGENGTLPDKVTMNAILTFFCKAGMVDVAIELYNSRSEMGLTFSSMAYNYLINTLYGSRGIDEAYQVLRNSMDEGYFPGKKTFVILADALCSEGKLDKMKELIVIAMEGNNMLGSSVYNSLIAALCKADRLEDGCLFHGEASRINRDMQRSTYVKLILGFAKSNRGDIAASLLLEMQEKGHEPNENLFKVVICSLFGMQSQENQFLKFMEMQLSRFGPKIKIYNFFINGAGHAKKPEVAREVFEMMKRSSVEPSVRSDIVLLHAYLKNHRFSDALNFFKDLRGRRRIGRKIYNTMVVGLCKAKRADLALTFMREMKANNILPTIECYEDLIQLLCWDQRYDLTVHFINELEKTSGLFTPFIGNVLLFHSFRSKNLYEAWIRWRDVQEETSNFALLGQLIGAISGGIDVNQGIESLKEMIEECFPPDIYTFNLLLRKLCLSKVDHALQLFDFICQRGYEPNQWTYDIIVRGLLREGRRAEADRWLNEMFRKGFDLTKTTKPLV